MTANETNALSEDNSDGQDESIDSEPHTDGGVSRRRFLGAAAALSTLPAFGGTAAAATDDGSGEDVQEDDEEADTLSAGFHTDRFDFDASYTLRTYQNDPNAQVGLEIGAEFGGVTLEMTAERAERLGHELLEAAQAGDA